MEESRLGLNSTVPLDRRQTDATSKATGDAYSCGVGNPCSNGACCGESGYCGFGPTYCGTGCTSNCNAKADCGQYAKVAGTECPLNVCCSQFGFCGTTSDFCDNNCQSNCGNPKSPGGGGDVRDRVIGYYESWSATKDTCGKMDPSQIPVEGLTHLNYAFAYVNPGTYDIVPMSGTKASLFNEVTSLKQRNPDLKVWVSIGGWSFSDNNTATQAVFGDAASSLTKRAQFANKLTQFMNEYGFDGADIDWEYPGAPDRGGSERDIENYPLLLDIIKYRWKVEGKSWGLSFTAPTSYWYLRWFDLPSLVKYADWINLMTYDLHGIWDSSDPVGPYVYAHTNLTEIDLALELFWRVDISPSKINLGLALYGRTFELTSPACISPGCGFSGPGAEGDCTRTAGILSYSEIQEIITKKRNQFEDVYDEDAGVKYLVYNDNSWVSYDDKTTFQQKIDFANQRGLAGLLIWAVDMDDSSLTGLKSITGKDLTALSIPQSSTLGNFNVDKCFITNCKGTCPVGFTSMTKLNQKDGKGCSGKDHSQRQLCCPSWGAPDPSTCRFRGKASECYGQCNPGEVLFATDNYGGASHCVHGTKAFCCPATSGATAVAACEKKKSKSCPSDLPQKISKIVIDGTWTSSTGSFCCPSDPTFSNCGWHGSDTTCSNNRCPSGQIEMARSQESDGSGWGCMLGRQKVLCCDPPFNGSAFIPVELDYLFPNADSIPSADAPVYAEAFDHDAVGATPSVDLLADDPNKETFAWYIAVGAEADVQSLRKRDGSQLETFDCPNPSSKDYSSQKLKAICMTEGDDHNCEDLLIGGAHGTLLRLPEDCGPDTFVRVVSFDKIDNYKLPAHLGKRSPQNPRVYEIKYDYNFRQLRRDGGEIYIRLDASNHPGYWDSVVASKPAKSKRSSADWREEHLDWFHERTQVNKRGYSTGSAWWTDIFNQLLNTNKKYGLSKKYSYSQVLYSASRFCAPSTTASVSAQVIGELGVNLDYGLSLICTLKDFTCTESYAYFRLGDLNVTARGVLEANAGFIYQSQTLQLLDKWDPFGAAFNLKGLWTVGPYFDATAQIRGQATLSGQFQAGASWLAPGGMVFMFPQALDQSPSQDLFNVYPAHPIIKAGTSASIDAAGSVTLTVTPAVGFTIELDALGSQLINTDIRASFDNSLTLQVGASTDSCKGANYGLIYGASADVSLKNPLPGWSTGIQSRNFYKTSFSNGKSCYPWTSSNSVQSRDLEYTNLTEQAVWSQSLFSRDDATGPALPDPLFPDVPGRALKCPNTKNTTTGDCGVSALDDDDAAYDITLGFTKRSAADIEADSILQLLDKRASSKPPQDFCASTSKSSKAGVDSKKQSVTFPKFEPSSYYTDSDLRTFAPLSDDCDDYSFGQVTAPGMDKVGNFATEHILEAQLLTIFLDSIKYDQRLSWKSPVGPGATRTVKSVMGEGTVRYCKYFYFWWNNERLFYNGEEKTPLQFVSSEYPGVVSHSSKDSSMTFVLIRHRKILTPENSCSLKVQPTV
jgi:chitinase